MRNQLTIDGYTPILAGCQFCIRVMILENALPLEKRDNMSEQEATPMRVFRAIRNEWLVEGEPSPFNYIHKLLNYGYMIGKDVKTRTRVRWSTDEKRMYFDGRGLDMRRWKKFVRDLVDMAEEMLRKRLLFESNIPMVDLNITDNPDKSNTGHYFLLDENDAFTKRREGMLRRLQQSGKWDDMIENKRDELQFLQSGIDEYRKWDEKFRELLCVLCILTCGKSGRGTEMTSLLYMNTMQSDRNILLEDGQFMLVGEYHKSMAIMDVIKVNVILFF